MQYHCFGKTFDLNQRRQDESLALMRSLSIVRAARVF